MKAGEKNAFRRTWDRLGLVVEESRPGDGITRYTFWKGEVGGEYSARLYTALGWTDAVTFTRGYEAAIDRGHIRQNPPTIDVTPNRRGLYGWVITKDHFAEPGSEEGTNENAVGIMGPRNILGVYQAALAGGGGEKFRMYDDDDQLVYEGRFIGDVDGEEAFGPLDDFGAPNFGCTRIDYRNPKTGKWETL